jgi:uncharacterized protein YoxC
MKQRTAATTIMAVIFLFSALVINAQTSDEEYQKLYEEYSTLNQELQVLQQQAYQFPEITEQAEEFYGLIDQKMLEIEPKVEELLEQRDSIEVDFQIAQNEGDEKKIQELQQNYQEINSQLQPLNQHVMQLPEIQEKQAKLENDVRQKMHEIEPETSTKIERLQVIQQELQQMQQKQ